MKREENATMTKSPYYVLVLFIMITACDDKTAELAGSAGVGGDRPIGQTRDMNVPPLLDAQSPNQGLELDAGAMVDARIDQSLDGPLPQNDLSIDVNAMDAMVVDAETEVDAANNEDAEVMADAEAVAADDISTCTALFECTSACGEIEPNECEIACRTDVSDDVQAAWLTMMECLDRKSCLDANQDVDLECAAENCRDVFVLCLGADALPAETVASNGCGQLAECDVACNNDPTCRSDCASEADNDARMLYANYLRCIMNNGEASCGEAYEACFDMPLELNCDQLFECIRDCPSGDPICAPECIARASDDAIEQSDAYEDCIEASACAADDYACRVATCEAEGITCFGDVSVPDGLLSCSGVSDCLAACAADDEACANACFEEASPEGYNQFFDFITCSEENDCPAFEDPDQYVDCIETNCATEANTCFEDTLGQGRLSCEDMYDCVDACPEEDAICISNCVQNASAEGLARARAYEACFTNSTCAEDDYSCELAECSSEIIACFGSVAVPNGTQNCDALNTCLGICADDDIACEAQCIRLSEPAEYNEFITLSLCAQNSGCNGNSACINSACANEIAICQDTQDNQNGGDNGSQLMDCDEFNSCLGDCAGDIFCGLDCEIRASGLALSQHRDILDCAELNGCLDLFGNLDNDCVDRSCASQLDACFGPVARPSGTGTCPALFTCIGQCADNQSCIDQCITVTSPNGYESAIAFSECVSTNCPNNEATCISQNCQSEQSDCLAN